MSSTVQWGKRARGREDAGADDAHARVRYSDLAPQQKLQRRRDERCEKKEMARTLAYFTSVQRALHEQASGGSGDAGALASLIDGFFTELLRRLRADTAQLRLLRNGVVCRTIEAALANALLLQSKSLLYVLLGHMFDLVTSPVASHTIEVLCMSLVQGLCALQQHTPADVDAEMDEHGAGAHAGSGVGSTAALLASAVEELCERVDELLTHDMGAQTLRSLVLVLGGYSIRGAPAVEQPIVFVRLLDALATSVAAAIARVHGGQAHCPGTHTGDDDGGNKEEEEHGTEDDNEVAAAWLAALRTPSTSFVLQSLLRVCVPGSRADAVVRVRLERLRWCSQPLLLHALRDRVGVHTFQAYIAVPTPQSVIDAAEEQQQQQQRQQQQNTTTSRATRALLRSLADTDRDEATDTTRPSASADASDEGSDSDEDADSNSSSDDTDDMHTTLHERTRRRRLLRGSCWGRALRLVQRELRGRWCGKLPVARNGNATTSSSSMSAARDADGGDEGARNVDKAAQTMGYVLHDLALYAPSEAHLRVLWDGVLQPRLRALVCGVALSVALTAVVRKCAFGSAAVAAAAAAATTTATTMTSTAAKADAVTSASAGSAELWVVPADVQAQLRHDAAMRVRYYDVSTKLQHDVCTALCAAMCASCSRGPLYYLTLHGALEQRGYELARLLLHLHPTASVPLQHAVERLRVHEVVQLAQSSKGSLLLQQLVRAAALHGELTRPGRQGACGGDGGDAVGGVAATVVAKHDNRHTSKNNKQKGHTHAATTTTTTTSARTAADETRVSWLVARTLHRLLPHLRALVYDRYGGYVVEVLYSVSNVQMKEELLHALVPLYHELRNTSNTNNDGDADGGGDDATATAAAATHEGVANASLQRHVARKVMTHCCVEQYVHRRDDWQRLAERQWQVQRLVRRILLQL